MHGVMNLQLLYRSAPLTTGLSSCRKSTSYLLVAVTPKNTSKRLVYPLPTPRRIPTVFVAHPIVYVVTRRVARSNNPLCLPDPITPHRDYPHPFTISISPTPFSLSTLSLFIPFLYSSIIVANHCIPHILFSTD